MTDGAEQNGTGGAETMLREALHAAQHAYDQLIERERSLEAQLTNVRDNRLRQEGYIAALGQILGVAQNGSQEQQEGTEQVWQQGEQEATAAVVGGQQGGRGQQGRAKGRGQGRN